MHIDRIEARQIIDTRKRPTVETTIYSGDIRATASVPSGKSTGSHEACELRDADGSVATAVKNVNEEIAKNIAGQYFDSLNELDKALISLDGTPNKSRLGANAILSVSIAAMRLYALQENTPLWKAISKRARTTPSAPRLYVNVMNGGVHANFRLPFQEYLLVVEGKTSTALPLAQGTFTRLGKFLGASPLTHEPMGDEGGYAPTLNELEKPFEILSSVIAKNPNMTISIDAAASELFNNGSYNLIGKSYSPEEFARLYETLASKFSFHSIEDPFAENAPDDFARLTASVGEKVLVIGDDLTVTSSARIKDAAARKEINAVLIKPNQIGTVREAIEAVQETHSLGFKSIVSHRSGETMDTFIADFAYGVGAHGIKAGGFGQRERLVKYERLLAIEHEAEAL